MKKKINLKERFVEYWDVSTMDIEDEAITYLDRQMRVKFHSAVYNNRYYVFIRKASDQTSNSITVSSYRKKRPGENMSVSDK